MSDEQPASDEQAAAKPEQPAAAADAVNVESLRVTVDAQGMVVPDGDPAGTTVLTGQAAADALAATRAAQPKADGAGRSPESQSDSPPHRQAQAPSGAESKARKAAPEDK